MINGVAEGVPERMPASDSRFNSWMRNTNCRTTSPRTITAPISTARRTRSNIFFRAGTAGAAGETAAAERGGSVNTARPERPKRRMRSRRAACRLAESRRSSSSTERSFGSRGLMVFPIIPDYTGEELEHAPDRRIRAAVFRAGAQAGESLGMKAGSIPLVARKTVSGVEGFHRDHPFVAPGLGQNRSRGDGKRERIPVGDPGLGQGNAGQQQMIDQQVIRNGVQIRNRAQHRQMSCPQRADPVDFRGAGRTDRPGDRDRADHLGGERTLAGGHLLGIAHLAEDGAQAGETEGKDHRPGRERAGPGAAAGFVKARHHDGAPAQQAALAVKSWAERADWAGHTCHADHTSGCGGDRRTYSRSRLPAGSGCRIDSTRRRELRGCGTRAGGRGRAPPRRRTIR